MVKKERIIQMLKVSVNGRKGEATSTIPHSNGKIPVWYHDGPKYPDFVIAKDVIFE